MVGIYFEEFVIVNRSSTYFVSSRGFNFNFSKMFFNNSLISLSYYND